MSRPRTGARLPASAELGRWLVLGLPLVLALLLARVLVGAPLSTLGVAAGLVVGIVLLLRVEWTALLFVAVEPFEDYVRNLSGSAVKGLGVLLVLSWLVHAALPDLGRPRVPGQLRAEPRPVGRGGLTHPVALSGIALVAVTLASTVVHTNGSAGSQTLTRYLSFLGALIVLVDLMYEGLPVRRVAAVFVTSCAIAAVAGLINYLGGAERAAGPLGDPNDFAFFLVAALPLALVLRRDARRAIGWDLAALLILSAMVATLSRGALLAVVAMIVFAVVTGVIRARVVAVIVAALVVVVAVLSFADPSVIENSLAQKQSVAAQNVDERLTRWQVTAEMTADYPLLGIGPGGFKTHYVQYIDPGASDVTHQLDVAHETYLEVSAELGLLGLATFLAVLTYGFVGAYRRFRRGIGQDSSSEQDWIAGGVCASLIGTAVAAIFLTEQYYLPLWLLAAFGAALDPRHRALRIENGVTMGPMTGVEGVR